MEAVVRKDLSAFFPIPHDVGIQSTLRNGEKNAHMADS
jgi:hypothetical protein